MTIAEWCVPGALFLYLATIGLPKALAWRTFDNDNPRAPGFYSEGWRARALGAHQNGIEAFPFFAFAVLLTEFRQAPQAALDHLAILFLVLRLAYVALYLLGWGWVRSAVWSAGLAVNLLIFLLPLWH
ncbi:MAG TPA: MAPEG family protein [Rhizomicrobium sp.]